MTNKNPENEKKASETQDRESDNEIKLVVKRMRVRSSVKVGDEESGRLSDCY
jgi:hypothetical protein